MSNFQSRHIGPKANELESILKTLSCESLSEFVQKTLPATILSSFDEAEAFKAYSEPDLLEVAQTYAKKNEGYKSIIGQGYYGTHTPSPILRNVFQNPGWYTAYTPYQAEISQGRLEALINFQTMVTDLTGMEISNSSLLDEGTALAEAASMALNISRNKSETKILFVEEGLFPQSLSVLKTRMKPLGVEIKIFSQKNPNFDQEGAFAVAVQNPSRTGEVLDTEGLFSKAKEKNLTPIAVTDLMYCLSHKSPGEEGAEIVVGSSQRFGVPMGYGGPHAAYLATKDKHKRLVPGRIIGVSKDSKGKMAYRLALQTREQHIRREKATSNICTAQVLLAVMASMYAVYHGPKGLKKISLDIKKKTNFLLKTLKESGYKVLNDSAFDTISLESTKEDLLKIKDSFEKEKINLRYDSPTQWGFSIDETCDDKFIQKLCKILNLNWTQEDWIAFSTLDERQSDFLTHPSFNSYHTETEIMRYMKKLENKDFSLVHGMIPLGSCTMKLNAASEMIPVTYDGFSNLHPFAPDDQVKGYELLINELNEDLCKLTGFSKFSFQPNSGAQGEYAGLLTIKKYHEANEQSQRTICLVPTSAHGTNPASAALAGFKVVTVKADENGNIDPEDLQVKIKAHEQELAAFMVTYPSTHGVYEENIREVCDMIHKAGGLVYMDGANMNALVGLCKPTELGMDVCHLNLHKTFCIPHGGGGPGVGPIGVVDKLVPHLPKDPRLSSYAVSSAKYGSASILPISWAYIKMMGSNGLKKATEYAVLNANYIAKRLSSHFNVLYKGQSGMVAHECIIDTRPFKDFGFSVDDFAKRLIDYGFHAPTMSWPVIGTLMIEPTESESKQEMDRFCDAMISIAEEAFEVRDGKLKAEESPLKNAPHSMSTLTSDNWPYSYSREKAGFALPYLKENKFAVSVDRVDNAYGDRNLFCSCPPIEDLT